jgi:hypothetical protein
MRPVCLYGSEFELCALSVYDCDDERLNDRVFQFAFYDHGVEAVILICDLFCVRESRCQLLRIHVLVLIVGDDDEWMLPWP